MAGFGLFLGALGPLLGALGRLLGLSWEPLWCSWAPLGDQMRLQGRFLRRLGGSGKHFGSSRVSFCDVFFGLAGVQFRTALRAAVHTVGHVLGIFLLLLWCGGLCAAHGIKDMEIMQLIHMQSFTIERMMQLIQLHFFIPGGPGPSGPRRPPQNEKMQLNQLHHFFHEKTIAAESTALFLYLSL